MTRLVLGSASPGRLKVLRDAGIEPLVIASHVDEDVVIAALGPDAVPSDVVCVLAAAKAAQVATTLTGTQRIVAADCVVVACDSMLYIEGRLLGKPASIDEAREQWRSMAGRADQTVVYCRIGERSSHTWFVLTHLLGKADVRNYDGSWTEWGNAVRVPIVAGEEPGVVPVV